jgi:hypothetical protein
MLDSLKKRPGSLRWPPRQRFVTTDLGRTALAAYAESIARYHAREQRDREEMDRIQQEWAESYKVLAPDAAILSEFTAKDRLPREVQGSLDSCGVSLQEVQSAVDRLFTAGLLAPTGGGGPLAAHAPPVNRNEF